MAMAALAFTMSLAPSMSCRNYTLSCRSHPSLRSKCFSVSSVLSSPLLADQSSKFVEASKSGNLIPLHQCIFSDHLTPALAYRCLVDEDDQEVPSFLFETVETRTHAPTGGRYSVVGAKPVMEIVAKENRVTVMDHQEGWRREFLEDPMMILQRITEKWVLHLLDELPQVFYGGWVGYFSYDTKRYSDKSPFSSSPADDTNLPDVHLGLYDDVLVFDHVEKRVYVIHWVQLDRFPSTEAALENGTDRLESLLSKVYNIVNPRLSPGSIEVDSRNLISKLEVSSLAAEAYKKSVLKAKEHISAGDISEVVLSQRFERRTFTDPFDVYRTLRIVNPSPLMAYLQIRGCVLVASSPEILTCVEQEREITNHYARLGKQLLNGERHHKEHIVLTDWAKIKAMKLIDELERHRRGPYGGAFICISFSGDMDLAVAPKTIAFPTGKVTKDTFYSYENLKHRQEWVAYLQGWATIIAESDPTESLNECEAEAAEVALAIDLAESSFHYKD